MTHQGVANNIKKGDRDMTELENKLVEKILEKIDMDKLTDMIAEKAAELIVQKEYPSIPITPGVPITPGSPWTSPTKPIEPIVVMYGVSPTEFKITTAITEQNAESSSTILEEDK